MKEGWVCEKLSNCIKLKSGDGLTVKKMIAGDFPVFGGNGIAGYHNAYNLEGKNIIIGRVGAQCGNARFTDEKIWLTDNAFKISEFNYDFNFQFLNYLLNHVDLRSYARQAAQPVISNSSLKNVELCFPTSIEEQKQIVAILDKAFAAIDQAQANIEKNIENAKELFENWTFQTIKNANWNTINWGEVCDFTRGPFGGSLKKSMFVESGYAVYEQKQAIHNDYDALRYFVDEEKFQEMKRFEVKPADLLMSCSGVTLGRISEVPEDAPKGIINQALLKLTAKPGKVLNEFLVIWIRSKIFQDLIFKVAGGAAQPNVPGVKILKNLKLPCPTITEQEDFIKLHDSMKEYTGNSITANIRKNESLEELKKSILQKAFSGELTKKSVLA